MLLWRLREVAGDEALVNGGLALLCVAVMVALAPRIHRRPDLKGQLAASTVSQMAFMFLAMAVGLPVLAITHLIGHGIYKANRFMSAGGAIEQRARLRRRMPRGRTLGGVTRLLGAVGLLAVAVLVGASARPDGLAVMGVFGPAAIVVWWTRTGSPVVRSPFLWLAVTATLAVYGWVVFEVGRFLEPDLPKGGFGGPWWSLGLAALVAAAAAVVHRRTPRNSGLPIGATRVNARLVTSEVAA